MLYMADDLTTGQLTALALLPKLTGGLSCLFSLLISVTILRDKSRRRLCYHRLLCGISLVDMSASFWMFMSTWPVPSHSEPSVVWAVGGMRTCLAQGFMVQFSITSPIYNAGLAIYYFLVIVRGWKEKEIRRIEWLLHAAPLTWGITTSLSGLLLGVYGNANLWCWVTAEHYAFRWAAYYGPLWCAILVATACCVVIYLHVRRFTVVAAVQQSFGMDRMRYTEEDEEEGERKSGLNEESDESDEKQEERPDEEAMHDTPAATSVASTERRVIVPDTFRETLRHSRYVRRQSRRLQEIAHQCFWYAAAFYITFAAVTTLRVLQTIDSHLYSFPLVVAAAITVPMQGLPNFLIYLRPKLKKIASKALARHCCCCRPQPSPPWWYRLAKSLSEKHGQNDMERAMGPQIGENRPRAQSSAAVAIVNPTVINDTPYYPKERENEESAKQDGHTVLVVVDTDEGRRWHIESKPNNQEHSRTSLSVGHDSAMEEQTFSGSTKESNEKNDSVVQKASDEGSNKGRVKGHVHFDGPDNSGSSSSSSESDW